MLLEYIFTLGFEAFSWLINLFANVPLLYTAVHMGEGVAVVFGYMNDFVSVTEIIAVSSFCFAVDHVAFMTRALKYLKQMIPFI